MRKLTVIFKPVIAMPFFSMRLKLKCLAFSQIKLKVFVSLVLQPFTEQKSICPTPCARPLSTRYEVF
jgi:hypothetical protein